MWGVVAKILSAILGSKLNQNGQMALRTAMNLAGNSARTAPEPKTNQLGG